ncbi:MAG TPA: hypothetical protein DCS43_03625 [Verrucomicrobia bacterium]|nr:hypothetical protein [Verrucomicrobiota bacterium]
MGATRVFGTCAAVICLCRACQINRVPIGCNVSDRVQSIGSNRVNRGGSWNNTAANCRSANRNRNNPTNRNNNLGFRVALAAPAQGRGWMPFIEPGCIPSPPVSHGRGKDAVSRRGW